MSTSTKELIVTLGLGFVCIFLLGLLLAFANPSIDQKCAANGGQIFSRPGELHSCIYPAK